MPFFRLLLVGLLAGRKEFDISTLYIPRPGTTGWIAVSLPVLLGAREDCLNVGEFLLVSEILMLWI